MHQNIVLTCGFAVCCAVTFCFVVSGLSFDRCEIKGLLTYLLWCNCGWK